MKWLFVRTIALFVPIMLIVCFIHKSTGGTHTIGQTLKFAKDSWQVDVNDWYDAINDLSDAIHNLDFSYPDMTDNPSENIIIVVKKIGLSLYNVIKVPYYVFLMFCECFDWFLDLLENTYQVINYALY